MCGDDLPRDLAAIGESHTFRFYAAAGEADQHHVAGDRRFRGRAGRSTTRRVSRSAASARQGGEDVRGRGRLHDPHVRQQRNGDRHLHVNVVVVSDTSHAARRRSLRPELLVGSLGLSGESDTFRIAGRRATSSRSKRRRSAAASTRAGSSTIRPARRSVAPAARPTARSRPTSACYTLRVYDSGDDDTGDFQVALCNPTDHHDDRRGRARPPRRRSAAGGDQPIIGTSLKLKDSSNPQKRRIVAIAKSPEVTVGQGQGSGDDPTQLGGKPPRALGRRRLRHDLRPRADRVASR